MLKPYDVFKNLNDTPKKSNYALIQYRKSFNLKFFFREFTLVFLKPCLINNILNPLNKN